jgi:hypothetical protein
VAAGTVWLIAMMLSCELGAVASKALSTIKAHAFFRPYRLVRIMATGTRNCISGFLLAPALFQRLELAGCPQSPRLACGQYEISNVLEQIIARLVFVQTPTRSLDRDSSFQVALHAHLVTKFRVELPRIYDRPAGRMSFAGPVAPLANHSRIREDRELVAVFSACNRRLNTAPMAFQAAHQSRQVHGNLTGV